MPDVDLGITTERDAKNSKCQSELMTQATQDLLDEVDTLSDEGREEFVAELLRRTAFAGMRTLTRVVGAIQLALIFPAALFMTAVLVAAGDAPQYDLARIAQRVVMWYSARMWMLWLLLLALPLAVLVTG